MISHIERKIISKNEKEIEKEDKKVRLKERRYERKTVRRKRKRKEERKKIVLFKKIFFSFFLRCMDLGEKKYCI